MKQTGSKGISRRRFLAAGGGASAGLAALLPGALTASPQASAAPATPTAAPALPGPPGPAFHQARVAKLREMMKAVEAVALI
jgi:hypothetical protein